MKKLLFFGVFVILPCRAFCQFIILNPGAVIHTVEDIEVVSGKTIFATDNGIFIYNQSTHAWTHFDNSNGLPDTHVKSLEPFPGGFMYSTQGGHMGNCDFTAINDQPSVNYISAICISAAGDTLLGASNHLVYVRRVDSAYSMNPATDLGVSFGMPIEINEIHTTSSLGDVFMITTTDKAEVFDINSVSVAEVSVASAGLVSNRMYCNAVYDGRSYIGTDKGVTWTDLNDWPAPVIQTINKTNSSLLSDTITSLAVSGEDVYIGTHKGLTVFKSGAWHTYTTANSNIPSSDISKLGILDSVLYIGTADGALSKLGDEISTGIAGHMPDINPSVYPNPAHDICYINSQWNCQVAIYDISGRMVATQQVVKGINNISVKDYPAGSYSYYLYSGEGITEQGILLVVHK